MQLSPQEGLQLGKALYDDGRLRETRSLCHELLRTDADQPELLELLVLALMRSNDFEQALVPLKRLLALEPGLPMHHVRRGECLLGLEQAAGAAQCFEAALELVPEHIQALTHLATLSLARGENEAAAAYAGTVLQLNPDSADAHEVLARAYCRLGKPDAALQHFTSCIQLRPSHTQARSELARLLLTLGRHEEGIHQYRCALLCDASNVTILRSLAETLLLLERYDEAAPLLERLHTLRPEDASILLLKGQLRERQDDLQGALALYAQAARDEESTLDAFRLMMLNLRGQGRYTEALDCCSQLLAHEENGQPGLWWHQAQLLAIHGDYSGALAGFARHGTELLVQNPSTAAQLTAEHCQQAEGPIRVLLYPSGLYTDDLVFLQWLPLLEKLPAIKPVLLCPPLLQTLVGERFGIETVDSDEEAACPFSLSLYSLPQLCIDLCLDTGPAGRESTVLPAAHLARPIARRCGSAAQRPRIGLAWQGAPPWPGVSDCGLPAAVFAALEQLRDTEFRTLQWNWPHTAPAEAARLTVFDSAGLCRDYRDICELLNDCDLVLACDSAVAVLAALLGKQVLLLHQGGKAHWLSSHEAFNAGTNVPRLFPALQTLNADALDQQGFLTQLNRLLQEAGHRLLQETGHRLLQETDHRLLQETGHRLLQETGHRQEWALCG